jgi:hypothetical protein
MVLTPRRIVQRCQTDVIKLVRRDPLIEKPLDFVDVTFGGSKAEEIPCSLRLPTHSCYAA